MILLLIAGLILDALPHAGQTIGEIGTILVVAGAVTTLLPLLVFFLTAVGAVLADRR